MIEIDLGPFGQRHVADVLVVGVMLDHHHLRMVDRLHDGVGDRGLPRSRAAGDSDDQRLSFHGDMIAQPTRRGKKTYSLNSAGWDWNYLSKKSFNLVLIFLKAYTIICPKFLLLVEVPS
jgi:hypothetical protein